MTSPPPDTTASPALEPRQGPRVQALAALGRRVADENGLAISQNRMNRLVRRYITTRRADIDFRTWLIGYADPTGEAAVKNVVKERGW